MQRKGARTRTSQSGMKTLPKGTRGATFRPGVRRSKGAGKGTRRTPHSGKRRGMVKLKLVNTDGVLCRAELDVADVLAQCYLLLGESKELPDEDE